MNFERFKTSFEKAKLLPMYIIYGEEDFFVHEALVLLRTRILKDEGSEVSLAELNGEEVSINSILEELDTVPLFGPKKKRLVVVYEADGLVSSGGERLKVYLDSPSPFGYLVLLCREVDKRTSLYKILSRKEGTIACNKIEDEALLAWVRNRARHYGKQIGLESASAFVENIGNNLSLLDRHIEKVAISLGDRKNIELEDVRALVGVDHLRDVFELTGAVARRDLPRALRVLDQLLKAGEEPVRLIPLLTWQIRRLWQAKRLLKGGEDREALVYGLKVPYRYVDDLVKQTGLFSEEDLETDYHFLLEADLEGKTSSTDNRLLLEGLIFKLCKNKGR